MRSIRLTGSLFGAAAIRCCTTATWGATSKVGHPATSGMFPSEESADDFILFTRETEPPTMSNQPNIPSTSPQDMMLDGDDWEAMPDASSSHHPEADYSGRLPADGDVDGFDDGMDGPTLSNATVGELPQMVADTLLSGDEHAEAAVRHAALTYRREQRWQEALAVLRGASDALQQGAVVQHRTLRYLAGDAITACCAGKSPSGALEALKLADHTTYRDGKRLREYLLHGESVLRTCAAREDCEAAILAAQIILDRVDHINEQRCQLSDDESNKKGPIKPLQLFPILLQALRKGKQHEAAADVFTDYCDMRGTNSDGGAPLWTDPAAHIEMAKVLSDAGRWEDAAALVSSANLAKEGIRETAGTVSAFLGALGASGERSNWSQAVEAVAALDKSKRGAEPALISCLGALGEWQKALEVVENSQRTTPVAALAAIEVAGKVKAWEAIPWLLEAATRSPPYRHDRGGDPAAAFNRDLDACFVAAFQNASQWADLSRALSDTGVVAGPSEMILQMAGLYGEDRWTERSLPVFIDALEASGRTDSAMAVLRKGIAMSLLDPEA